jgi:hypothetical protein
MQAIVFKTKESVSSKSREVNPTMYIQRVGQGRKCELSRRCGGVLLGGLLSLVFLAQAAAAPYEPNEALPAAAGPLASGQTFSAALETSGDRDFFFFYVTSAGATQVELAARNLGGGSDPSDLDVSILDPTGTAIASQAFIRDGEARTVIASLQPQKYFVEVAPGEGFGDAYSLSAGGGTGAFGSYAQIAWRCELVQKTIRKDTVRVERAKAKLQRSIARLRRSRYAKPAAREKAQEAHREALATVKERRLSLEDARRSRQPWCVIAP